MDEIINVIVNEVQEDEVQEDEPVHQTLRADHVVLLVLMVLHDKGLSDEILSTDQMVEVEVEVLDEHDQTEW